MRNRAKIGKVQDIEMFDPKQTVSDPRGRPWSPRVGTILGRKPLAFLPRSRVPRPGPDLSPARTAGPFSRTVGQRCDHGLPIHSDGGFHEDLFPEEFTQRAVGPASPPRRRELALFGGFARHTPASQPSIRSSRRPSRPGLTASRATGGVGRRTPAISRVTSSNALSRCVASNNSATIWLVAACVKDS
jgi:hypothetical protein